MPDYKHHVFLSYSRKDADIMQRIRDDLCAAGLTVWTDEGIEPGTMSWKRAIEHAIEHSKTLVAILSPHAKQSEWVERELDYAYTHKIPIVPLLIRGDEQTSVPLMLISSQRFDLRNADTYNAEFGKFLLSQTVNVSANQKISTPKTISPHNREYVNYILKRNRRVQDRDDILYMLFVSRNFAGAETEKRNCEKDLWLMDIDYELKNPSLAPKREYHLRRMHILVNHIYERFDLSIKRDFAAISIIDRTKEKDLLQLEQEFKLLYGGVEIESISEDLYVEAVKFAKIEKSVSTGFLVNRLQIDEALAKTFLLRMQEEHIIKTEMDEDNRHEVNQ